MKALVIICLTGLVTVFNGNAQWEKVMMTDHQGYSFYASSELHDPNGKIPGRYSPVNLMDNDPTTAWVEGADGPGAGEYIILGPFDAPPREIILYNGYQKSPKLFRDNGRLKTGTLRLLAGITLPGHVTENASEVFLHPLTGEQAFSLPDTMASYPVITNWKISQPDALKNALLQDLQGELAPELNFHPESVPVHYFVKIKIGTVSPGARWDDTCISEVKFKQGENRSPFLTDKERVLNVYTSDDDRKVYVDTDKRTQLLLEDADNLPDIEPERRDMIAFTVMDVSPDGKWAQIDWMVGSPEGRAEEVARLYYIPLMTRVDPLLVGEDISGYYGFTVRDGKTWLDTDAGEINLDEVYGKLVRKKKN